MEVDKKFDDLFFKEDILKECEKLPNKVKISLEKVKEIDKEKNKLNAFINDCINIENNIKYINSLNEKINKCNNLDKIEIKFIPDEENEINKLLQSIKSFGKIHIFEIKTFNDSLIIGKNQTYINNIINWVNPKGNIKAELLYRKTRDGDSYDDFHRLCDNKRNTLVLIQCSEGYIIGGYTPLDWDKHLSWKSDDETFLFSLTNNKIFRKDKKLTSSIFCSSEAGPWFPFIGFYQYNGRKNLYQGQMLYKNSEDKKYFKDVYKIIPNISKTQKDTFFTAMEVEVYKILFI